MKKKYMIAVLIAVVVLFGGGYLVTQASGNQNGLNVFNGRIVSGNLSPGTYTNATVLTDEGCTIDPKTGLANCTSKIQTSSGRISFNYEHDMMKQPCLSLNDKVDVTILGGGRASVRRTYWGGGGA